MPNIPNKTTEVGHKVINISEEEKQRLEKKINELIFLNKLNFSLSSTLNLDEIINIVSLEIIKLINYDVFSLLLFDIIPFSKKKGVIKIMCDDQAISGELILKIKTRIMQEYNNFKKEKISPDALDLEFTNYFLTVLGEKNKEESLIKTTARKSKNREIKREISLPLKAFGINLGIIYLARFSEVIFENSQKELLEIVSNQTALALRNALEHKKLEEMAITDGLTNVFNYRTFHQILEREYKRAMRYNKDLSLVLFDLDHFKQINDTKGHQRGDEVLIELVNIVKKTLRETDVLARYGGEEFVLILSDTDQRKANVLAERIRAIVECHKYNGHPGEIPLKVTISMGISSCPNPEIKSARDLVMYADKALYRAKNSGRNMVCNSNFISYTRMINHNQYFQEDLVENAYIS